MISPVEVPSDIDIVSGFDHLQRSVVHNAKGVMTFDSGKEGPRLYVGTCTHGNETMTTGLAVPFLKGEGNGGITLTRGSVVIAVNNLLAAVAGKRRLEGDYDFNRLPPDILDSLEGIHSKRPSFARLRELSLAGAFDVTHGFDAHTLAVPAGSLKIHIKGDTHYADVVGERDYVVNIISHQQVDGKDTVAFSNFLGGVENSDVPVVEIEGGGPHTDPLVIRRLVNGMVAVLVNLGMVEEDLGERYKGEQRLYRIKDYQTAPAGFTPVRQFGQFEPIKYSTVIARDTMKPPRDNILSPRTGHMVMPPTFGESGGDDWWISSAVEVTNQDFIRARGL